jgi:hypothetical protein
MKTSASPARRARIRPKPWRHKIALSVRVAPLGLGCALLFYIIGLEIDRGFNSLNQLRSSSEPLPIAQIEHALAAVHTSMVELPGEGDARAIAHFTTSARMVWLKNGQLTSVVRKLETQYAGLVRRYEADRAQQQDNLANTQSELRRLQDQQDAVATQVGTKAVERDFTAAHKKPEGRGHHLALEASEAGRAVDEQLGLAAAIRNNLATKTAAPRSWISNTGLSSEPSARFAALQIARRLDKTRREALRSKLERIFTVDVQTRVLGEVAGSKLLQLDRRLNCASSQRVQRSLTSAAVAFGFSPMAPRQVAVSKSNTIGRQPP